MHWGGVASNRIHTTESAISVGAADAQYAFTGGWTPAPEARRSHLCQGIGCRVISTVRRDVTHPLTLRIGGPYVDLEVPSGPAIPREMLHENTTRSLVGAGICAALMFVGGAGTALAGEVKGPPNTPNNTNETGALDHANSICAASGLNDFDSSEGQTVSQVQTAADSWKILRAAKGISWHAWPLQGWNWRAVERRNGPSGPGTLDRDSGGRFMPQRVRQTLPGPAAAATPPKRGTRQHVQRPEHHAHRRGREAHVGRQ